MILFPKTCSCIQFFSLPKSSLYRIIFFNTILFVKIMYSLYYCTIKISQWQISSYATSLTRFVGRCKFNAIIK